MTLLAFFLIVLLLSLNVLFIWYITKLLTIINDTTEGIKDMKEAMVNFSDHLQAVYKQETYYGEPTIERLIKHSKILVQEIDQFVKVFLVSDSKNIETDLNINEKETTKQ